MERVSRGGIWTVQPVAHPKPRPALVVSINAINDLRPDVLLIPITTYPGPLRVPLPEDPVRTGLRRRSYGKCALEPAEVARLAARHSLVADPGTLGTFAKLADYRDRTTYLCDEITPEELCRILHDELTDVELVSEELRQATVRLAPSHG